MLTQPERVLPGGSHGHRSSHESHLTCCQHCPHLGGTSPAGKAVGGSEGCANIDVDPLACFAESDLHVEVTYHAADRYWTFQWIETAIFLALAGLLTGFCAWWLRRRLTDGPAE